MMRGLSYWIYQLMWVSMYIHPSVLAFFLSFIYIFSVLHCLLRNIRTLWWSGKWEKRRCHSIFIHSRPEIDLACIAHTHIHIPPQSMFARISCISKKSESEERKESCPPSSKAFFVPGLVFSFELFSVSQFSQAKSSQPSAPAE